MARSGKDSSDGEPAETKKDEEIKIVQVIKETEIAFQLPDGSAVDRDTYLVWLGNEIWKIKKSVA